MYVVNSEEMRAIDNETIHEIGIPGVVLMENAGRGVVQAMAQMVTEYGLTLPDLNVVVICGKGNNGGDGFVVARYLANMAVEVEIFLLGETAAVKGDARVNLDILQNMGHEVIEIRTEDDLEMLELEATDLIVDAIFGTGFSGAPRGISAQVIEMINDARDMSDCWVVSIDAPSGVDMNHGSVAGEAVEADVTVSMALPKIGHLFEPGRAHTGELNIVDIGVPPEVVEDAELRRELIEPDFISMLIPERNFDDFKSTFGKIAVLAGSTGMTGAATLTCMAAMRAGAGLVKLGIPRSLNPILEMKLTEVMTVPLPETSTGSLSLLDEESVDQLIQWADVLAIGPGLSLHPETIELVWREVSKAEIPLIVDADGLNALAQNPSILTKTSNEEIVLTPHPGEMARLLKTEIKNVLTDPIETARKAAMQFKCVIALKSAPVVVAEPTGHVWINRTGNPGLATGGSGDVLTGLIAGLLGQGLPAAEAAIAGVFIHGLAADFSVEQNGQAGLIASDLLEDIPKAILFLQGLLDPSEQDDD